MKSFKRPARWTRLVGRDAVAEVGLEAGDDVAVVQLAVEGQKDLVVVDEGRDDFCVWPLLLREELVREAVPALFVGRVDLCEVGVLLVQEGPERDEVALDGFGDARELFEGVGLTGGCLCDTLLLCDLLCTHTAWDAQSESVSSCGRGSGGRAHSPFPASSYATAGMARSAPSKSPSSTRSYGCMVGVLVAVRVSRREQEVDAKGARVAIRQVVFLDYKLRICILLAHSRE